MLSVLQRLERRCEQMVSWIKNIINKIKMEIRYRKRLKELRKRDPFIYK